MPLQQQNCAWQLRVYFELPYILQCQNRYLPSFRFLLGGLRFRKVMPLSSSKAVTSRSSGDCSFGRSPSPMYSIQVLPTSLGSEYIDTPGYTKTITIRCVECVQAIKCYIIFKWLMCDTWTKKSFFSSSKSLVTKFCNVNHFLSQIWQHFTLDLRKVEFTVNQYKLISDLLNSSSKSAKSFWK